VILLSAGEQVTVHDTGMADQVRAVDTVRALAWSRGQLVFENDTLADVIAQFNRYNRTQLRISDSQLAARRVSGVLDATDTETLLAFIRQGRRDIRVTRENGGIVIGTNGQ
jgi:transmembrane sensor